MFRHLIKTVSFVFLIPKRIERSELVHFVGIVPRLSPPVRPLIRMSAGKAWFHTPRLCRGTGSRLSDSGSRALPWGMIPFIIIAVVLMMLTASCRDSAPSAHVLAGNMSYARGQYQKSILQYLGADTVNSGKDVVSYNLANVYYALGEGDAALRAWAMAENSTDDIDILFRVAFNRGVLYYHWGRYDEAYRSFRRALTLKPSDIDAKINLEDALSRIRSAVSQKTASGVDPGEDGDKDSRHLLDYVRRKEADAWSVQTTESGESVEDW